MSERFSGSNRPHSWSRRALIAGLVSGFGVLAACGRNRSEPEPPAPAVQPNRQVTTGESQPPATGQATDQAAVRSATQSASNAVNRTAENTAENPAENPIENTATATSGNPANMPDRLVIPRIELDIPVVELGWSTNRNQSGAIFSEWDVAAHAAGWHKNSALPGQSGNIVMSGHNNILGAVFRQLDQLRRDDEISLYSSETLYRYGVERVVIVPEKHADETQRAENARWIAPTASERLTLVSCWPRNDNTHRIIVVARPVT